MHCLRNQSKTHFFISMSLVGNPRIVLRACCPMSSMWLKWLWTAIASEAQLQNLTNFSEVLADAEFNSIKGLSLGKDLRGQTSLLC